MELLRRVREFSSMPVIFLTSKDDELDEALGLAMGADDYISKPFSQRLLIARIRAILRRQELARGEATASSERARAAAARARPAGHGPGAAQGAVGRQGRQPDRDRVPDPGSARPAPGVVKTRNQLLDVAYNDDVYVDDRTIDSHIKRIRRKFRAGDPEFDAIETLYGVGYRFRRTVRKPTCALSWSGRWTLAHRILAVNVLTVLLVALSTLYLDVFRNRLSKERVRQTRIEATTTAQALATCRRPSGRDAARRDLASRPAAGCGCTARTAGCSLDSWHADRADLRSLRDPSTQNWTKDVARALDRGFNALVGAESLDDFVEPASRPAAGLARGGSRRARAAKPVTAVRNAPDLTPVISAAVPVGGDVLLATDNDRAFTRTVRSQRGADRRRDGAC